MIYAFDGETLALRHVSAAFNCCPGEIAAAVRVSEGKIEIAESEAQAGCRCECTVDLDLVVEGLPAGQYEIDAGGGYAGGLKFSVDLTAEPSGKYCEPRDGYPWK